MGFDVTFHPVGLDELQRFVFDVFNDPSLASARAAELNVEPESRENILSLYSQFPEWEADDEAPFEATFAVAAAAVAGWLHPYWYARGQALSFLAAQDATTRESFTSLPKLAKGRFSELKDASQGLINENYTASGFVLPRRLDRLRAHLTELAQPRKGWFSEKPPLLPEFLAEDGLESLESAISYATSKRLGLMEAADLVVPLAGEFVSNPENLRAHYLKKMDP